MQCELLLKVGHATRCHISEQVSTRLPLSHDIESVIDLEVVCDSKYVLTLLAAYLCIDLGNGRTIYFSVVLICRNFFDNDLDLKGVVQCNHDFSFFATLNFGFDFILLQLGVISLSLKDGTDKYRPLLLRAQEYLADLLPICVASELHRVQLLLCLNQRLLRRRRLCGNILAFFHCHILCCISTVFGHHNFL